MDEKQLKEFFEKYSIRIKSEKEEPNFKLYSLEECPFCEGAHKDGAYIIHNNNGVVVAKCHHNSCKEASWAKLYELKTGTKLKKPSKSTEKRESMSFIDVIDKAVAEDKLEVFLDNFGNLIARVVTIDDKIKTAVPVRSYDFKIHLQRFMCEYAGFVLDGRNYTAALDYVAVLAYTNNKRIQTYKRIYNDGNKIVYELDKDENLTVVITKDKVEVTNEEQIFFQHSKYYKNQVMPDFDKVKDGDYKLLLRLIKKHFNIRGNKDVALFSIYLVSSFLGTTINHPILSISGAKGSGKSSAISRFCQLVDPKFIGLGNIPKKEDDICLRISENYVNAFDNLSFISKNISDLFCRCVTGGTNTRRTLYENTDETTFDLKSIVVLNGIEVLISESDLLDRAILFHLERFESGDIKTEEQMNKEFKEDIPTILALCFSVLQLALKDNIPVDTSEMTRMADFYQWSVRIGRTLGYEDDYIKSILKSNQEVVNVQALSENPLAQTLLIYMEYVETRECTVTDLLKTLKKIATEQQIDNSLLPKQPNVLSRRLNQIRSNLESQGIFYEINNKGYSKVITIRNQNARRVPIDMASK